MNQVLKTRPHIHLTDIYSSFYSKELKQFQSGWILNTKEVISRCTHTHNASERVLVGGGQVDPSKFSYNLPQCFGEIMRIDTLWFKSINSVVGKYVKCSEIIDKKTFNINNFVFRRRWKHMSRSVRLPLRVCALVYRLSQSFLVNCY